MNVKKNWFIEDSLTSNLWYTPGAQPKIFQGRGGFVELGHFDNLFVKNTRKKGSSVKNFGAFSPKYF